MSSPSSADQRAQTLKERRHLQKKLREIEKLEQQEGPLQPNQEETISKKADVVKAITELGPDVQVLVLNPSGKELLKLRMERFMTAAEVSAVLVQQGLATKDRHHLLPTQGALNPDDCLLSLSQDQADSITLTLVEVGSSYFAAGNAKGEVSVYRVHEGRRVFQGHSLAITTVKISADRKVLLSASNDGTAKLWDMESLELLHTLQGHQANIPVCTAEFSLDSDYVVMSQRYGDMRGERPGVTVWRVSDGRLMRSLWVQGGMVGHGACWSPTSDHIVTCSGEFNAWLFCASTGEPLQYLDHEWGDCMDAFFSPDGQYVCTVAGGSVFVRRSADMQESNINMQQAGLIHVRNVPSHAPIVFRYDAGAAPLAAMSATGLCAICDRFGKGSVECFEVGGVGTDGPGDVDEDDAKSAFQLEGQVESLQFSPDGGDLLVISKGAPASLWDPVNGSLRATLGNQEAFLAQVSPDGRLVATFHFEQGLGHYVAVWRREDAALVEKLAMFEDPLEPETCVCAW